MSSAIARFSIVVLLVLGGACAGTERTEAPARSISGPQTALRVAVSIPPQKYFVERIAGNRVAVTVMVGPGESPATYEPRPAQMQALSGCSLYFRIGVPFEDAWLGRFSGAHPEMEVVDLSAGVERLPMVSHGNDHGHAEGRGRAHPDPHVWLSPRLVRQIAAATAGHLIRLDPEGNTDYQEGLRSFEKEIDSLDGEIRDALAGLEDRRFVVFHPSWGYFARDYDLDMIPVEVGGQEPSAAERAGIVKEVKESGIDRIFVQPEFGTRTAESIGREIGLRVMTVSPLGEDWPGTLRAMARGLSEEDPR